MAYNLFKGVVEGSVDQYGDQEIDGVKIFKNTISASVFYDTDAQSPCATIKNVAIEKIKAGAPNALLIYGGQKNAYTDHGLRFDKDNSILSAKTIEAQNFQGSAKGLRELQAQAIEGEVAASNINHGIGLQDIRGTLQIKASSGIKADDGGVSINIGPNSGLSMDSNRLTIDPRRTEEINRHGQNLSDQDLLLVADISRGTVEHTTLLNLYEKYIKTKGLIAAGNINEIQLKGRSGLSSSSNLLYDFAKNVLMVDGHIDTKSVKIDGAIEITGQVVKNIKKIKSEKYHVQKEDYTILCDSEKNKITVVLPPACNHVGRILVVKKVNAKKHKLNSYVVDVKVEEGAIDLKDTVTLKMNYASKTLQSDGENWCIIGASGA